jgi:hypothetical protein
VYLQVEFRGLGTYILAGVLCYQKKMKNLGEVYGTPGGVLVYQKNKGFLVDALSISIPYHTTSLFKAA